MWAVKYSSLYHLKYGGGYRNEKKKYCTRDISGLKIFNQTGISTKCHTSSNRLLRKLFVDACWNFSNHALFENETIYLPTLNRRGHSQLQESN